MVFDECEATESNKFRSYDGQKHEKVQRNLQRSWHGNFSFGKTLKVRSDISFFRAICSLLDCEIYLFDADGSYFKAVMK